MAPTADTTPAPSSPAHAGEPGRVWRTLVDGSERPTNATPFNPRRLALRLALGTIAVLLVVGLGGTFAARRLAEREAVNDAAQMAGLLADSVVKPYITDDLVKGTPAARTSLDALVRARILGHGVVRVKVWDPSGKVLYADEPALVGVVFPLSEDQRSALDPPSVRAEISDLSGTENTFEKFDQLVEVYQPMWTPSGQPVLFEVYTSYDPVGARTTQLWRGFAGVTISSLLLLVVLLAPLLSQLARRLREGEQTRAALLQRAVDASTDERRRIAASLHDGPVQELAAASFAVSGAAAQAAQAGDARLAGDLDSVSGAVRASIRSLRTLLVDIYPPSLDRAGLAVALGDLAHGSSRDGTKVELEVAPDLRVETPLSSLQERAAYRVAQETLRNAFSHADANLVRVRLEDDDGDVVLLVEDDGVGFDVSTVLAHPEDGHFGLRLLSDAAREAGGRLDVASAPGAGTAWCLRLSPSAGHLSRESEQP